MREVVTALLLVGGTLFMLLAGLGLARMPDFFLRLQTAAKAATFGLIGVLGAAAVALGEVTVVARVGLGIGFVFAITPVAAQLLARAAFRAGVPLWERTGQNDLTARRHPQGPEGPSTGPDGGG